MALIGGPLRSPDDSLVFKVPGSTMQDQASQVTAGGLLEFHWTRAGVSYVWYSLDKIKFTDS